MELKCSSLLIITLFATLVISNAQGVVHSDHKELISRVKRQLNILQGTRIQNAVLNLTVPVNKDHYKGESHIIDNCPRNQVAVGNGSKCEIILSRGSCKIDEVVVLNPANKMGHCAPRLCPPDRIFVQATQQCHDPQDTSVCPDSRELFLTAYGTAICDCPVGTVESSNGLNVVVCEPILSKGHFCKEGQVIWFKDFNSPAQCLPDPCHGKNLQRLPGSLPFVPSQNNGECHQLGQTSGVCLPGLIYALHLPTLSGVCETLENLGYEQFNQTDLAFLNRSIVDEEKASVNETRTSLARDKRQVLPAEKQLQTYNSTSNGFVTLKSCSPGSNRDINAKCRETFLPGFATKTRRPGNAPPNSINTKMPRSKTNDQRKNKT